MSGPLPPDPGAQRVVDLLGTRPAELLPKHPPNSPLARLAELVSRQAAHLDDLAHQLRTEAGWVAKDLLRISERHILPKNRHNGVLQNSALAIDLLVARLADAHTHLDLLCRAYRDATAADEPVNTPQPTRVAVPAAVATRAPQRPGSGRSR